MLIFCFFHLRPPSKYPGVGLLVWFCDNLNCWLTFERLGQLQWNFWGLLGWWPVTFGWEVHLPSPYGVGPGLHPGLLPEIYLLCGFWCHWDVSYHFGKDLMRQTVWVERNFALEPRCWVAGVEREGLKGLNFFGRFCRVGEGNITECDVVVGCILFGMHFSQSKMHFY